MYLIWYLSFFGRHRSFPSSSPSGNRFRRSPFFRNDRRLFFCVRKQQRYLQNEGERIDEEKHKNTPEREANMATSSASAGESEHTYFELRSMRAPQDQVNTERQYQELQHTSDSTEYENVNEERRQGVYQENVRYLY